MPASGQAMPGSMRRSASVSISRRRRMRSRSTLAPWMAMASTSAASSCASISVRRLWRWIASRRAPAGTLLQRRSGSGARRSAPSAGAPTSIRLATRAGCDCAR